MAKQSKKLFNDKLLIYQLNPKYFKDSDGNGYGDLLGIAEKADYFKFLGVNSIVLHHVLSTDVGAPLASFTKINEKVGTIEELKTLVTELNKRQIKLWFEIKLGSVKESIYWFREISKNSDENLENLTSEIQVEGVTQRVVLTDSASFNTLKTRELYLFNSETHEIGLNWNNDVVQNKLVDVVKFWHDIGVRGFVVRDFEYACDAKNEEQMSPITLKALKKIYEKIKQIDREIIWVAQSDIMSGIIADDYVNRYKVFDKVISRHIAFTGRNWIHGNDYLGLFTPREITTRIKEYVSSSSEIINFGSSRIGRVASRWGSSGQYWKESAKSIAILFLIHPGSKMIYMGDELGMTNLKFNSLDDFNDSTIYERLRYLQQHYEVDPALFFKAQKLHNPINVCVAMPWNNEVSGGFSGVNPNVIIHPRVEEMNVENQFKDKWSILSFYKRVIAFTKTDVFTQTANDGIFKIKTTFNDLIKLQLIPSKADGVHIIAMVNLSKKIRRVKIPRGFEIIFSTYNLRIYRKLPKFLDAYESIILVKRKK